MTVLRSILVAVDGSAPSLAALEHAVALAEDYDATIEVLEVVPQADIFTPVEDDTARDLDAAVEHARVALGDRVTRRTIAGEPVATIVDVASGGHDLIVLGTHGRIGRLHSILGSVAEGVVRNAPCPVLTVRDPGDGYQSFAESRHHRPTVAEQARGGAHARAHGR
jgi:nucleotide-binding universal stress UspA family protein